MITANLKAKRALVTGGASGIGLATAELFARLCAEVVINDLAANPALQNQADRLAAEGLKVIAVAGDVGNDKSAHEMVMSSISQLGGLDYLINNAGTPGTSDPIPADNLKAQSEDFWRLLLNVNLQGPFRCTAAAISALQASKGAIVNTASTAGVIGGGSSSAYSATKAALINLTREHARAFGPDVRVNAIAPGLVASNWACRFDIPEDKLKSLPLKRSGQPEDYAETILFLCAGAAYITGQTLIVDGGLTAGEAVN